MNPERRLIPTKHLALGLLLAWPSVLCAESGNATLVDDATVYENASGDNGGGDAEICIGNLAITSTRRAFIRYALPDIPAGSTVDRVTWQATQVRVRSEGTGPRTANLSVRRVTADWVEGTGSGPGSGPCGGGANVAGVDWSSQPTVSATVSATAALPTSEDFGFTIDTDSGTDNDGLLADVQAWVDGASNFGWRLAVGDETIADNSRVMLAGTLTVYWTPPAGEPPIFADGFETITP